MMQVSFTAKVGNAHSTIMIFIHAKRQCGQCGYTLIELIIVISLLAGLSTVVLLNSTDSRNVIKLNNAARELEGALMEAQALGNGGRAFPPGDATPEAFDRGYGVFIDEGASSVIMYGGHGDLNDDDVYERLEELYTDPLDQEHEEVFLTEGTTISNIYPSNAHEAHILYTRRDMEAHLWSVHPDVSQDKFIITLKRNGIKKKIVVTKTGLIYIDD